MTTAAPPEPDLDRWQGYAVGTAVDHFVWWAAQHCEQSVDRWAGMPLTLEAWQVEFMGEALALTAADLWAWGTVVLVLPRKNGKTALLAAYALYRLVEDEGSPEILLAASSDEQAGRLFDYAAAYIRRSAYLTSLLIIRDYVGEIARRDGAGVLYRLSSDAKRLHGYNPSLVICDELHAWTTPSLRAAWGVLTTADAARSAPQVFAITTAGEAGDRETGILGRLLDDAASMGEVVQEGAKTIIRHARGRTLLYVYEAEGEAVDPRPLREAASAWMTAVREYGADSEQALDRMAVVEEWRTSIGEAAKAANPASWITADYLAEKAESAALGVAHFLQLHCNVWSDVADAYIPGSAWDRCAAPGRPDRLSFIAPGRSVDLGADGSRTYDTTAVAWASMAEDGIIEVDCHVFSARADAPHHELHPGGRIRWSAVESFLDDRFDVYRVVDVAYDPRYLDRSADLIVEKVPDARVFAVEPQSKARHEAEAVFERLVADGKVRHRGDAVLRSHVTAAKVERDPRTGEIRRVSKRADHRPIDAVAAMSLAVWRASRRRKVGSVYARRELRVIG